MKSRKLVVGVASILATSLGLGVIAPADGQVNESPMPGGAVQWGLVDAIGYGGLGFGLGLLATRAWLPGLLEPPSPSSVP